MEAPEHSPALLGRAEAVNAQALIRADSVSGRVEPAARRRRQSKLVQIGRHPISLYLRRAFSAGLLLHTAAPRLVDAGKSDYRCGTCRFAGRVAHDPLTRILRGGPARPYVPGTDGVAMRGSWKCWHWPDKVTRGSATTIRLMWPACRNWLPKETDAAPDPAADAS